MITSVQRERANEFEFGAGHDSSSSRNARGRRRRRDVTRARRRRLLRREKKFPWNQNATASTRHHYARVIQEDRIDPKTRPRRVPSLARRRPIRTPPPPPQARASKLPARRAREKATAQNTTEPCPLGNLKGECAACDPYPHGTSKKRCHERACAANEDRESFAYRYIHRPVSSSRTSTYAAGAHSPKSFSHLAAACLLKRVVVLVLHLHLLDRLGSLEIDSRASPSSLRSASRADRLRTTLRSRAGRTLLTGDWGCRRRPAADPARRGRSA